MSVLVLFCQSLLLMFSLPVLFACLPTMANFRRFRPDDLNKFSKCNLDPLTETYELNFYLQYYAKWPMLFQVAEDSHGNIIAYSQS
jgi:ribosomal protein S18 acetylase RimI-like enzyme